MDNNIILPSPTQTELLAQENIPPPIGCTLADLQNPAVLSERMQLAKVYERTLKRRRMDMDHSNVALQDVEQASSFSMKLESLAMVPIVSQLVPNFQLGAVLDQLQQIAQNQQQMQQQITQMQQQMAQMQQQVQQQIAQNQQQLRDIHRMSVFSYNCSAKQVNNTLFVPPSQVPENANQPPPEVCPRTFGSLLALDGADLSTVETYFGLGHDGLLVDRRNRVVLEYGLRLQ